MLDVTALGELLIDFSPAGTGSDGYPILAAHPGGAPANFLAALSRYGAKTALLGKVGHDTFGNLLIGTLHETGIETRGIVQDTGAFTTMAFVTLDADGDRTFAFARRPGADTLLRPEEVDLTLIDGAKIFHFGTLSLTDEPARAATQRAVAHAKRAGKLITYDPNLRRLLWPDLASARAQMLWGLEQADVVKISDDETDFLFSCPPEEAAQKMLAEYGVQLVFVTLGKDGCCFANHLAQGRVAGVSGLTVVDTTGAGDIFGGAAVSELLRLGKAPCDLDGEALRGVATFACVAASLSTQTHGGIGSVPERRMVDAYLTGGSMPC